MVAPNNKLKCEKAVSPSLPLSVKIVFSRSKSSRILSCLSSAGVGEGMGPTNQHQQMFMPHC